MIAVTCSCLGLVFLVGYYNVYKYLVKLKKYKVYPLTLCYIVCQTTIAFAIVRVSTIEHASGSILWLHIANIGCYSMLCVGVSQLVTLLELLMKTIQLGLELNRPEPGVPEGNQIIL